MINSPIYDKKNRLIIDMLVSQSLRTGVMTTILMLVVGAFLLAHYPLSMISLWVLIGLLINVSRHYVYQLIRRHSISQSVYFRLEVAMVSFLFLSALFWGTTGWLYIAEGDGVLMIYIAIPTLGVVTGALPAYSARPYIWFIFASTIMCLLAVKFVAIGVWELAVLAMLNLIGLVPLCLYLSQQIHQSITLDFKNAELLDEVQIEKDKAEKASLAKSQFLAAASHDLRQPLHAQGILLEALSLRLEDSEHSDLVDKTLRSNEALNTLLNALLEISQLDAGAVVATVGQQSMRDICQLVLGEYQIIAQKKGLTLELECEDCAVLTDSVLLIRILRNLVNNAIKFTAQGSIVIKVQCQGDTVELSVIDTGIGIPSSQQQRIFDEYVQLDNLSRDRSKGIGLGLALVRRMCLLLQHDICVSSIENQGTRFVVTLPRGNLAKVIKPTVEISPFALDDVDILLLDDEQPNVDAMSVMLSDWGCRTRGFTRLSAAEYAITQQHYQPDLIISDYRLNEGTDGLAAIKALQKALGRAVPALIVSGDTDPTLLEKIHQQDYYLLHKPLKSAALKKVIRIVLKDGSQ